MDKRIKTPMIIGIVLQGLAVVIALGCYLLQGALPTMSNLKTGETVFPDSMITMVITLLLHIITLLVMQTYEGESRRMIGGILAAAYCIVNVATPIISRITAFFDSRKGAVFIAAKGVLASMISMLSSPFTIISLVFVLIAVGRYGVLDRELS